MLLAVALGNEVSKLIKDLVGRERPVLGATEESFSFPSGHAMVGLTLVHANRLLYCPEFTVEQREMVDWMLGCLCHPVDWVKPYCPLELII